MKITEEKAKKTPHATGKTYQTKDIAEASFLLCSKQTIIQLVPDKYGYYSFIFDDDKDSCGTISLAYWSGEGKVNALHFANIIRQLRGKINTYRGENGTS